MNSNEQYRSGGKATSDVDAIARVDSMRRGECEPREFAAWLVQSKKHVEQALVYSLICDQIANLSKSQLARIERLTAARQRHEQAEQGERHRACLKIEPEQQKQAVSNEPAAANGRRSNCSPEPEQQVRWIAKLLDAWFVAVGMIFDALAACRKLSKAPPSVLRMILLSACGRYGAPARLRIEQEARAAEWEVLLRAQADIEQELGLTRLIEALLSTRATRMLRAVQADVGALDPEPFLQRPNLLDVAVRTGILTRDHHARLATGAHWNEWIGFLIRMLSNLPRSEVRAHGTMVKPAERAKKFG